MNFWDEQPAFLIGISFLIGIGVALFSLPLWAAGLWLVYVVVLRRWTAIPIVFVAGAYAWLLHGSAPMLESSVACTARFSIHTIQTHQSPFHQSCAYKGILYFDGHRLPCSVSASPSSRPAADCDYLLKGTLQQRGPFDYVFKAKEWTPVKGTWSLAELRFQTKERLKVWLSQRLHRPRTASLLFSLSSGEIEERLLRYEFGRLGLQHILAISGFHFGVLVSAISACLGIFLPIRWKWLGMLVLASAYFLFIGAAPAVQRAWIAVALYLIAKLLRRPVHPVNLLGGALLIELIANPLVAANLGFQLSFGSCLGILLLHPWFEEQLCRVLPKRRAIANMQFKLGVQLIAVMTSFFRAALSLTLAVNAAILPLLLLHFGKFPLLGLLYNLFYPLLVSIALMGLMGALAVSFIADPLSTPLFAILDWWTEQLLHLVAYPPLVLDRSVYFKGIPLEAVIVYLFGGLLLAVHGRERREKLLGVEAESLGAVKSERPR